MKIQLHSKWTFFQRRVFPVLIVGIIVCSISPSLWQGPWQAAMTSVGISAAILIIFGLTYRTLVGRLVDEAYLVDGNVEVRRGGVVVQVPLSQVREVTWQTSVNPQSITLHLSQDTAFGRSVSFMVPGGYLWGRMPKLAAELRQQIATAQAKNA